MADKRARKLAPKLLQSDLDALDALAAIDGYTPSNAKYAISVAQNLRDDLRAKQAKEVQDDAQAKASRDAAANSEWDVHEFVLGASVQIKAQFGENSDEYASLGFKKKMEYKNPKKKPAA